MAGNSWFNLDCQQEHLAVRLESVEDHFSIFVTDLGQLWREDHRDESLLQLCRVFHFYI